MPKQSSSQPPLPSWRILFSQTISFMHNTPSAWVFGCVLSLPIFLVIGLESIRTNLDEININPLTPVMMLMALFAILSFFIGESGLILSFRKNTHSPLEYLAAIGALIRWYFFFFLALLILFTLFFSPLLFIPEGARTTIQHIGIIFFCFTASIAFILKMFGGFYLLLGKLSLENSLRASATVFTTHAIPSWITFLAMTLFSFVSSMIISGAHSLLIFPLHDTLIRNTPLILVISILALTTDVFFRAFWYFFFQSIATEKPEDWQKEKKVVQESMIPIEDEA